MPASANVPRRKEGIASSGGYVGPSGPSNLTVTSTPIERRRAYAGSTLSGGYTFRDSKTAPTSATVTYPRLLPSTISFSHAEVPGRSWSADAGRAPGLRGGGGVRRASDCGARLPSECMTASFPQQRRTTQSKEVTATHPSVLSPEVQSRLPQPADEPANPDPTESQRGCLRLPRGALSVGVLNTWCPSVPGFAPRSRDLEMRYTG
jgi:hypothetical protein